MSLDAEKIAKSIDQLDTKLTDLSEKLDVVEKAIHNLDAFCKNILEANQKTIYRHIIALEGQEAEESEEEQPGDSEN